MLFITSTVLFSASALAEDTQYRRTLNLSWQEELAEKAGKFGIPVSLNAGCRLAPQSDGSVTDVSNKNPKDWVAYNKAGKEVKVKDYKGKLETAPLSLIAKLTAIAKTETTGT